MYVITYNCLFLARCFLVRSYRPMVHWPSWQSCIRNTASYWDKETSQTWQKSILHSATHHQIVIVKCRLQYPRASTSVIEVPQSCTLWPLSFWGGGWGWVGLWGYLWWAPSAKRKDHHRVSSGWSSVWHRSNTGLSITQYEQIPIIHVLGVWPFWLTPFFFRSITFWRAYG